MSFASTLGGCASWQKNNKPWKGAKGENEGRWWTSLRLALSFSRDKWLAVEKRFRLASSLNSLVIRRGDDRRRRSYEDSTLCLSFPLSLSLSLSLSLCPSLSILFPLEATNFLYRVWLQVIYDDVNCSMLKLEEIVSLREQSGFFWLKLSFDYFLHLILFFFVAFFIFRCFL